MLFDLCQMGRCVFNRERYNKKNFFFDLRGLAVRKQPRYATERDDTVMGQLPQCAASLLKGGIARIDRGGRRERLKMIWTFVGDELPSKKTIELQEHTNCFLNEPGI